MFMCFYKMISSNKFGFILETSLFLYYHKCGAQQGLHYE